jgi:hypothetical protein
MKYDMQIVNTERWGGGVRGNRGFPLHTQRKYIFRCRIYNEIRNNIGNSNSISNYIFYI